MIATGESLHFDMIDLNISISKVDNLTFKLH